MNEGLLLDTCAVIWIVENKPLSDVVEKLMDEFLDKNRSVFISPFSGWEVSQLMASGRLPSLLGPHQWFDRAVSRKCTELAELNSNILIESCQLPGNPPRDPADRIIISTARYLNLRIVTRDRFILDYANSGYVKAIKC